MYLPERSGIISVEPVVPVRFLFLRNWLDSARPHLRAHQRTFPGGPWGENRDDPVFHGEAGLFTPALLPGRVGVSAVRDSEA